MSVIAPPEVPTPPPGAVEAPPAPEEPTKAIGLGYGEPAGGLMKRKPRSPEQRILPTSLMLWLRFGERDELESAFSLDVLRDRKFLYFSGASFLAIILAPQLDLLNRILETVPLTLHQSLVCIVAGLAAVVASELRKAILRHREHAPDGGAATDAVAAAPVASPN